MAKGGDSQPIAIYYAMVQLMAGSALTNGLNLKVYISITYILTSFSGFYDMKHLRRGNRRISITYFLRYGNNRL